jgi:hypothetical protein
MITNDQTHNEVWSKIKSQVINQICTQASKQVKIQIYRNTEKRIFTLMMMEARNRVMYATKQNTK